MKLNESFSISLNKSFSGISIKNFRQSSPSSKLSLQPRWRMMTLILMGTTVVLLTVATMSTGWREDQEDRYDVFITHGLWRVCRDIKFGSTVDHQCLTKYTNEGPSWFQCVRTFMMLSMLLCFAGFFYGVYLVARLTPIDTTGKLPRRIKVTFLVPGLIYLLAALCVFVGAGTYSIATAMKYALYFPENLPPTWGNSWSTVLAVRNTIPSELPDVTEMKMKYGYSFGLAWFSFITSGFSGILCLVGSLP